MDHAAIDDTLYRLRAPTRVHERIAILKALVEYWHGPIGPQDGFDENELNGVPLPFPLWSWYRWAGRRGAILSGQNKLLTPDELELGADDWLIFYRENQCCYEWATSPIGEDTEVFGRCDATEPWESEEMLLSEHLILACLFEAVIHHSPFGASAAWVDEDLLAKIAERVPPIPLRPWCWVGPTRFYGKNGAFMFSMPNGEVEGRPGHSISIGAKELEPVQFLAGVANVDWDRLAL